MSELVASNREQSPKSETIIKAMITGLEATYRLHEGLGDFGTAEVQQNQFGDTALVLDVRSEEIIIDELRKANGPFRVFSEEHGEYSIGKNPTYSVVVDGLDGSMEYKKKRGKGMYGAMVCIMEGSDPDYNDYVASGIMIHSPKPNLLLAVKNQGVFSIDLVSGDRKPQIINGDHQFSEESVIDLDLDYPPYKELFDRHGSSFPNMRMAYDSEAARCALYVEGSIDIALEWTRKHNLEQPTMYGFVVELGGIMTGADGVSIGSEKFTSFGQVDHIPLIIAPNQSVATSVSNRIGMPNLK